MAGNVPGASGPNSMPVSPEPIDQQIPVDNNQGKVQRGFTPGHITPAASPARGPAFVKPPADLGTPFNSGKTCPSVGRGPSGKQGF